MEVNELEKKKRICFNLEEFTLRMKRMLEKKKVEYQDSWEHCEIELLITKLGQQVENLKLAKGRNHAKKVLTHIANYSYLIFRRLGY